MSVLALVCFAKMFGTWKDLRDPWAAASAQPSKGEYLTVSVQFLSATNHCCQTFPRKHCKHWVKRGNSWEHVFHFPSLKFFWRWNSKNKSPYPGTGELPYRLFSSCPWFTVNGIQLIQILPGRTHLIQVISNDQSRIFWKDQARWQILRIRIRKTALKDSIRKKKMFASSLPCFCHT